MEHNEFTTENRLKNMKPDTSFDQGFAHRLKMDLMDAGMPRRSIVSTYFSNIYSWSELRSNVLVALIALLVVVPLTYIATEKTGDVNLKGSSSALSQRQQITVKPNNAFGTIAMLPSSKPASKAQVQSSASTAGPALMSARVMSMAAPVGSSTTDASSTPIDLPKFSFTGTMPKLENSGLVFKRTVGQDSSADLVDILKGLNFELANLSTFNGLAVNTIHLSESKPYGYELTLDVANGMISIIRSPSQWPTLGTTTNSLSNTDNVAIADAFLKDHGIDVTNYASPVVVSASSSNTVVIIYPLTIDKRLVYDVDGKPFGITVTIDPSFKRVSSVTNINSQTYESSKYDLIQNSSAILDSIDATTTSEVGIPLVSATKILVRTTQQNGQDSKTELYVPGLNFKTSSTSPEKANVVVPLLQSSVASST